MEFFDPPKRLFSNWLAHRQSSLLEEAEARKTPAMRQYEYAVARKSILGTFSSDPIAVSQQCLANEKARRRKERLELVNREIVSCPAHAKEAARLRQDMDEVENMRCAKHVYLANDPHAPPDLRDNPPPGFTKATPEQLESMGLKDSILRPDGSNFRAAVYIKDPTVWGANPKPAAIVAFRGSTAAEEDWQNNFAQDCNNESSYYRNAVRIGNRLAANDADAHIVGHSLGGGLASAAQGGSGLTASTYNAAGLHPATVASYSEDYKHLAADPDKITAIRLKGEVLTKTQESLIGSRGLSVLANDSVGRKQDLVSSHSDDYFQDLKKEGKLDAKDEYGSYLHGMDEVIDSAESEKAADEATLKDCLHR